MLTLEVAKIPAEGLELDSPLEPREVHIEDEGAFELEPGGRFVGRVDRGDEDSLHVRGRVLARLRLECGRCLERFLLDVEQELDVFYLPHHAGQEATEADDEVGLSDREMVVAYYDGERLDLGEVLREQLFLALPMKRVCRTECRGLCPTCGANRNTTACVCPQPAAEPDPRLLVLGALLDKEPGKGSH